VFDKDWIPILGARFKLGVDGISLWLVLLTTFLTPLVLLSSWRAIDKKVKEFTIAFLVLETGMLGAFLAVDLFVFYVMWEVMLIPMYFIIGIWGGERRVYASIKFVIYTMVGSLLMLVAIFYLYTKHGEVAGVYTFDLEAIYNLHVTRSAQMWCFAAFALAFAIKVPLFPVHTWLPDAHVEAPTAGSVILAGVLLKFGIYGFIRYAMPIFPYASHQFAPLLVGLAVAGIVYGAVVAFAQEDVKKLVAYSSVSHLGFCVLGLFALNAQGIEGSIYAMISHGLTTGGLFLGIGVLYERRHTRRLDEFGGLWAQMPVFAAFFLIVTLGSAGLPGLSGFVGEFLALIGTYDSGAYLRFATPLGRVTPELLSAIAATGVILGAVYLLYMFQKVMFGPLTNEKNKSLPDLSAREMAVFLPLLAGVFVLGLFPRPFLRAMEPSVKRFAGFYTQKMKEDGEAHLLRPFSGPGAPSGAVRPGGGPERGPGLDGGGGGAAVPGPGGPGGPAGPGGPGGMPPAGAGGPGLNRGGLAPLGGAGGPPGGPSPVIGGPMPGAPAPAPAPLAPGPR
jgi:NADH-quinone oxidoreductase subunit M